MTQPNSLSLCWSIYIKNLNKCRNLLGFFVNMRYLFLYNKIQKKNDEKDSKINRK